MGAIDSPPCFVRESRLRMTLESILECSSLRPLNEQRFSQGFPS